MAHAANVGREVADDPELAARLDNLLQHSCHRERRPQGHRL
jgi:hypothetical protein